MQKIIETTIGKIIENIPCPVLLERFSETETIEPTSIGRFLLLSTQKGSPFFAHEDELQLIQASVIIGIIKALFFSIFNTFALDIQPAVFGKTAKKIFAAKKHPRRSGVKQSFGFLISR